MSTHAERLATSLEQLKALQRQGVVAVRARQISRVHRERLVRNGFLREVFKGWYISTRPAETPGESTVWYAAYWPFAAQYLEHRFGERWCLGAEQSLLLHVGERSPPPSYWCAPRPAATSQPLGRTARRCSTVASRCPRPHSARGSRDCACTP